MFTLKDSAYFKNSDFNYSDSSLHGRLIWYSNSLYELKEPVLMDLKTDNVIYRLLLINNGAKSIRIVNSNNDCTLHYFDQNDIVEIKLTKKEWKKLERKIRHANFWSLPTTSERRGKDGFHWILEGNSYGNYHVVDRWSPKKHSRYRKVCEYIIELKTK